MNVLAPGSGAPPPGGALGDWLAPILASRGTSLDPAQTAACARLQRLSTELESFRVARQSTLKKLFATTAIRRKTRIHFHAFMRDVHDDLAELKREVDPLAMVAERIAGQWRLICFDEFHVSDIADAMILGRLLGALFTQGVVFVMTTNYPPDALWPNGLQRERFLPT